MSAEYKNSVWQWETLIQLKSGQAYVDPVFLEMKPHPIRIASSGHWDKTNDSIEIIDLQYSQDHVVTGSGHLSLEDNAVTTLDMTISDSDLNLLFSIWAQPFLVGNVNHDLALEGRASIHYSQEEDDYQFTIQFQDTFIAEQNDKFSFDDVNGTLSWTNTVQVLPLEIKWNQAYVYDIPLGKTELYAITSHSTVALTEKWSLPILDGELTISDLTLDRQDPTDMHWSFSGSLTPISMQSLSTTLGWPEMSGKLSGMIPRVSFQDDTVTVDGALMIKVFDGTTVMRNLRLVNPLGTLPQLYADIDMRALDLETLTSTFNVGKITGKLDGDIHELRLSNWKPVHFNAQFNTPEGDKSRRRISQRAVDNLSQVGGGATGVLSRSFLRFFEDFSYQALGLGCALNNDVCVMSGVGESDTGYYIVKGGGLPPRINVVGYTRRVGWSDLIERLKSIQNSEGPVIQ
jgi:hypothetical protein